MTFSEFIRLAPGVRVYLTGEAQLKLLLSDPVEFVDRVWIPEERCQSNTSLGRDEMTFARVIDRFGHCALVRYGEIL